MKKEIKQLVNFALSDTLNKHKSITVGTVTKKQAAIIQAQIGVDMYGCERILDTSTIRHIIKNHGSAKDEAKRGQIAVNLDDIQNIAHYINSSSEVAYLGKNKLKQDVFKYQTAENGVIVVVEAVRINKRGNAMIIQTMYKIKKSNRK